MRRRLTLVLVVWLSAACNQDVVNTLAWPAQVVREQTVSLAIDSNFGIEEQWDLSRENVTVRLDWQGSSGTRSETLSKDDGLRVIEAWQHPGAVVQTVLSDGSARGWVSIVVFDVPDDTVIPNDDLPATITVSVLKNSQAIPTGFGSHEVGTTIEVVAGGPAPTLFPSPAKLEPPPLLRVAARWNPGPFNDPAWSNPAIGSIEFEIAHPSGLVISDAYPISDAAGATVTVGPGSGQDRRKIVLVDPDGFILDDHSNPGVAGEGPFLDIAFEAGPFVETDFTIYDLVVSDTDGNVLISDEGPAPGPFDFFVRGPRQ